MAKQLLEMASVEPHRILSPEGTLLGPLPEGVGEAELKGMYRWMVRLRTFDQRALTPVDYTHLRAPETGRQGGGARVG